MMHGTEFPTREYAKTEPVMPSPDSRHRQKTDGGIPEIGRRTIPGGSSPPETVLPETKPRNSGAYPAGLRCATLGATSSISNRKEFRQISGACE